MVVVPVRRDDLGDRSRVNAEKPVSTTIVRSAFRTTQTK